MLSADPRFQRLLTTLNEVNTQCQTSNPAQLRCRTMIDAVKQEYSTKAEAEPLLCLWRIFAMIENFLLMPYGNARYMPPAEVNSAVELWRLKREILESFLTLIAIIDDKYHELYSLMTKTPTDIANWSGKQAILFNTFNVDVRQLVPLTPVGVRDPNLKAFRYAYLAVQVELDQRDLSKILILEPIGQYQKALGICYLQRIGDTIFVNRANYADLLSLQTGCKVIAREDRNFILAEPAEELAKKCLNCNARERIVSIQALCHQLLSGKQFMQAWCSQCCHEEEMAEIRVC